MKLIDEILYKIGLKRILNEDTPNDWSIIKFNWREFLYCHCGEVWTYEQKPTYVCSVCGCKIVKTTVARKEVEYSLSRDAYRNEKYVKWTIKYCKK